MLSPYARHQILERRVNNVGLKGPKDFIPTEAVSIRRVADGCQQGGKARIGDDQKVFVDLVGLGLRQDHWRDYRLCADTGDEFIERVCLIDEKESTPPSASEIAHATLLSRRPLR